MNKIPSESPSTLVRALGPWIAVAVVVGNVIGSGIFLKPGNIAADGGNFGLIVAVWVFGGVLCILGALCFAELAAMLPQAGGMYVYLREAYGRLFAFLFGWTEFLFGKPASIGALAVAFIGSLTLALDWEPSTATRLVLPVLLILSLAWVNVVGVLWGGRLQFAVTAVKAAFLALVALAPLVLAPFIGWTGSLESLATTVPPTRPGLAAQTGAVLLAVMWAYNGWHAITPLAEEVREPQRNVPRALFYGISILIVLYVSANVAYHSVLSMSEMKAAGDHAAERMLEKLLGSGGLAAMSAVIMCSTFGAINSILLEAPRVTFAMGRDGVFPKGLAHVHARHRTPAVAIVVTALMAVGLIVAVSLAKALVVVTASAAEPVALAEAGSSGLVARIVDSLRNDSIFELLTNFVIFSASIFYMLAVLAVIVLRVRRPEWPRPYRTWGYPLVPLLFLGVYGWFLNQIYFSSPFEAHAGLVLVALGVPVYYGIQFRRKTTKRRNHE